MAELGRVGAGADDGKEGRREELAGGGLGSHCASNLVIVQLCMYAGFRVCLIVNIIARFLLASVKKYGS
jgi:hypothetical protein